MQIRTAIYFFFSCLITINAFAGDIALRNNNTAENPYYFFLTGVKGQGAYCIDKGISANCYGMLPKDAEQWVRFDAQAGWIDLQYDVCASVKDYKCDAYVGHLGISLSPSTSKIDEGVAGGTAQGSFHDGKFWVTFTADTPPPPPPFPTPSSYSGVLYRGINLAGAEFDSGSNPPYAQDALYFVKRGMNIVRLPFKWEYLHPDLNKPIDFTQGKAKTLVDLVKVLTNAKIYVLIDMHNYMRYKNEVIGKGPATIDHFANAWGAFAQQFANNPYVMFDLMNEPYDMPTEDILTNYNAALKKIRAAGFTNLVLLEGNAWSGLAHWNRNFYGTPNAVVFAQGKVQDNNYAINVHEYFDDAGGGGGGEGPSCVAPSQLLSVEKFDDFMTWVKANKAKVFLSELGGKNLPDCIADIDTFLTAVEKNPYQQETGGFIGWTGWAAGHAWPVDYVLNLTPYADGSERAQMTGGFANPQSHHLIPAVILERHQQNGKTYFRP